MLITAFLMEIIHMSLALLLILLNMVTRILTLLTKVSWIDILASTYSSLRTMNSFYIKLFSFKIFQAVDIDVKETNKCSFTIDPLLARNPDGLNRKGHWHY